MSGQQTIYTIHESQLNNGGGSGGQRASNTDILIDTSSIPMTQQAMPPMQHQHLQLQAQQQQHFDTITSQPLGSSAGAGAGASGSARVAPESQGVVYSVHPVFSLLEQHDALLIRQRAEPTSTCCGFESANTYTVRSRANQPLLKAIENSNCCERCCFEGNREYNLALVHQDEVVARVRKPYRVSRLCCYTNAVRIESPEDNPIGHVRQLFSLFGHPRYAIYDCQQPPKVPSFYVESVSCRFCCTPLLCTCLCGNREFRIISAETRDEVGTIVRDWPEAGLGETAGGADANADADASASAGQPQAVEQQPSPTRPLDEGGPFNAALAHNHNHHNQHQHQAGQPDAAGQSFGVKFAPNLEARHKVLLLAACFMMDFFYFENDRRRRKLASC